MPMINDPRWSAINIDGTPANGARLFVYQNGTDIEVQTYSDSSMMIKNTMPLIADSRGYFPVFFAPTGIYKVRVETDAGVLISEVSGIVVQS